MQFKIGDRVMITPRRDVNCPPFSERVAQAGRIGTIVSTSRGFGYHGRFEIRDGGNWHYCSEEEIVHVDGPQVPYDDVRALPWDKWMPRRQWRKEVK